MSDENALPDEYRLVWKSEDEQDFIMWNGSGLEFHSSEGMIISKPFEAWFEAGHTASQHNREPVTTPATIYEEAKEIYESLIPFVGTGDNGIIVTLDPKKVQEILVLLRTQQGVIQKLADGIIETDKMTSEDSRHTSFSRLKEYAYGFSKEKRVNKEVEAIQHAIDTGQTKPAKDLL